MPVVLVAEDEPFIRMSAADRFEEDGFEVLEAATARAALAILEKREGKVAALFTDIDVPGDMNGLELAVFVHHRWPHIVLVVTSGVLRTPGVGVFIAKPYEAAAPVEMVRKLMPPFSSMGQG